MDKGSTTRKAAYPIDSLFVDRWSPRIMTGEPLPADALMRLFEAARWAPSSYNNQPWRFLYALRDTPHWSTFFDLLVPPNQAWVKDAAALILVVSATKFTHNGQPTRTHSFDAGAAWQNLALQGWRDGLVVHGMQGFDADRARSALAVPEDYAVEIMIAVGHASEPTEPRREQPNDRRPLADTVREGPFAF